MEQEIRCYGCGKPLQSHDESIAGYVPNKVLESRESILCQRCFKLQHYNTNSEVELVNEDFVNILKNVGKHDALIVYAIDLFAFESSIIENLSSYLNNKQVLILANKRDLIPTSVKDTKLIEWIKSKIKIVILKIITIIVTSCINLHKFICVKNRNLSKFEKSGYK